jgi:hypothetical protein
MKLGIVTLAACTVVLAGSTVYFAYTLDRERERNSVALAEAAPVAALGAESATPARAGASGTPATAPAAAPAGEPEGDPASGSIEDQRRRRNREQAQEFLRRYDNPEARAKMLAEQIENQRSLYPGLRSELDIDAERFDRLIKLFAERQIDRRERIARCLVDILCLRPDLGDGTSRRQAIVDVIGEEKTAKLEQYSRDRSRSSMHATFQARLGPRLALSPQQLDELTSALFSEANRARKELESHGHETKSFMTGYGLVVYARDTKTVDERMASAAASIDRMRDRAGTLLNGEQLTIFNQTQDDALIVFRPFARVQIAAFEQGYEDL